MRERAGAGGRAARRVARSCAARSQAWRISSGAHGKARRDRPVRARALVRDARRAVWRSAPGPAPEKSTLSATVQSLKGSTADIGAWLGDVGVSQRPRAAVGHRFLKQ